MTRKQTLAIDLLRTDAGTQSRIAICDDTVTDYAELIDAAEEWPFPAVDVFHDGSEYYVADGFHRVLAGVRCKRASIPCRVHKGTIRDARIFAMTANDRHGLRMTRSDKRACVEWLLDNGGRMTQKAIAETAGVSVRTVKYAVAERNGASVGGAVQTSTKEVKGQIAPNRTISGGSRFHESEQLEDVETEVESIQEPIPGPSRNGTEAAGEMSDEERAAKTRILAHSLRDKLARAICDYHELSPNRASRDRLVKLVQGVELW